MLTMQQALLALTKYWTEHGCMIVQPFNTEVGAGTYNPNTALRVLGPEPWHVAYVEPSVRPDDARYGENPNRIQMHTQFQVILKPDPGNPQELYLGSLEVLGIDIRAHDVRFVEDNWASPALGAWGLGWEVWLDGLEITQFTYFQQAGSISLDPISVEITYGIERIMMALQRVDHFKKITYAPGISYGEAFGQAEYEMSRYYLDDADVDTQRHLFEDYATEAKRMLEVRLPIPAHYYLLKCSHAFNVLDARGAVSTTERATAFRQMRNLARGIAKLWIERRAELKHPLGVSSPFPAPQVTEELPDINEQATLLFEIGTEEMPAREVAQVAQAVQEAIKDKLSATRLGHGSIHTYATPRRVVTLIEAVEPREVAAEKTIRGPRASVAFDSAGQPTSAAYGFARSLGMEVSLLTRVDLDGVEFVAATKADPSKGADEVLSQLLAQVVMELRAEQSMRWNDPQLSFTRPIRWLVALLGDAEIPVVVSSLTSGRLTRTYRTADSPVVEVPSAVGYLEFLASHGIIADGSVRRGQIIEHAQKLAHSVDGTVDVEDEARLIDEITNLVEQPTPILCSFSQRYLELPTEVLTTVMRKHQRYLPVRDQQGDLMPYFVAVANGSCDQDLVREGNQAVLRARYEDAAFFWHADLKIRPEEMKKRLKRLAFEEHLGSMANRAERIAGICRAFSDPKNPILTLASADQQTLTRAAQLAKFDLASQMVIELTSLAGFMAYEYAKRAGEAPAVAQALLDMEFPRFAGDRLPQTLPGALLALADRFDLLVGLFSVGATPSGSSDPFGLRRAALGIVNILLIFPQLQGLTLTQGIALAVDQLNNQGIPVAETVWDEVRNFIRRRYEQQLLDAGYEHRLVSAVLPLSDAPATAKETLSELERYVNDEEFATLAAALQRVRRIVPPETSAEYNSRALTEPAEIRLHEEFLNVRESLGAAPFSLTHFIKEVTPLVEPINTFFDQVLVMAKEPELRAARLGLLASIWDMAEKVLDWQGLSASLPRTV